MKNRWYKILALSLVLALSLSALSSCLFTIGGTTSEEEIVDYMTEDEVKAMINGSMPSEVVIADVNNYDITIENSGGGNLAAAAKGDATAKDVIDRYVYELSLGLINLIRIFQPEVIVVGGGVARAGDALMIPLRERLHGHITGRRATRIEAATLGDDAGIVGAALLGMMEE